MELQKLKTLLIPILDKEAIQLYDISWHTEGTMRILRIAIMRNDGSMDIDTCAKMSEHISQLLDEADLISSEYFLEVCSPGAERELKGDQQIADAVNEFIYIKLKNPKAGLDEVKGYLRVVEDTHLIVEYMDKAVKKTTMIDKDNIAIIRLSVKI